VDLEGSFGGSAFAGLDPRGSESGSIDDLGHEPPPGSLPFRTAPCPRALRHPPREEMRRLRAGIAGIERTLREIAGSTAPPKKHKGASKKKQKGK